MLTNYGRADCVDAVWEKGIIISGKNPNLYRMDDYGNVIYKASYGKYSEFGWNIDHIIPISRGGTNHIFNLRPLNSRANSSDGNR